MCCATHDDPSCNIFRWYVQPCQPTCPSNLLYEFHVFRWWQAYSHVLLQHRFKTYVVGYCCHWSSLIAWCALEQRCNAWVMHQLFARFNLPSANVLHLFVQQLLQGHNEYEHVHANVHVCMWMHPHMCVPSKQTVHTTSWHNAHNSKWFWPVLQCTSSCVLSQTVLNYAGGPGRWFVFVLSAHVYHLSPLLVIYET